MQRQSFQTARSHEEPFGVQFSVFMPNRVGQFRELLDAFAERDVRVLGVSVVDATDWAVIRLITDDPDSTRDILHKAQHSFTESAVILVELSSDDALRDVCSHLLRAEINVHFAFPLTLQRHQNPIMAFHVDDIVLATQILMRRGLTLIGEDDLAQP